MSKTPSAVCQPAPKRRFSRGDGVRHEVFGDGHVSGTGRYEKDTAGAGQWLCRVKFVGETEYVEVGTRDIPESELLSLPGTGQRKYGQGAEGCRATGSRYGERRAQRELVSNGRTVTHTLVRHHRGENAR